MQFAHDPAVTKKIQSMQRRVRWQSNLVQDQGINQTHLVLDNAPQAGEDFSFLVIGDSGTGKRGGYDPQLAIAEQMQAQRENSCFIMHTGDVVYLVGSSEYYRDNFIRPYRQFLQGGDNPKAIAYDKMVFNLPFLPVPGNHDYYDLPLLYGLLTGLTQKVREWFPIGVDWDVGWHGSFTGDAYARAFMDCLDRFNNDREITKHFQQHYAPHTIHPGQTALCLQYKTGEFTRIPNRYYSFRMGDIDFFALDSNTFNVPLAGSGQALTPEKRDQLKQKLDDLAAEKQTIRESMDKMRFEPDSDGEDLEEMRGELEQIDEIRRDIEKQLNPHTGEIDWVQLKWLETGLIASWNDEAVRGRVLFFHHPPYVTETSKWYQGQTHAIRDNLRTVLDKVGFSLGWKVGDRPLVDLVINGHAHCLEHLETLDTGHGDSHTNWLVCGGSGYSLRRQRREGTKLQAVDFQPDSPAIAESKTFFGKIGSGRHKRRAYSFLRIDVAAGDIPKFVVRPFISERFQRDWHHYPADPFTIQSRAPGAD